MDASFESPRRPGLGATLLVSSVVGIAISLALGVITRVWMLPADNGVLLTCGIAMAVSGWSMRRLIDVRWSNLTQVGFHWAPTLCFGCLLISAAFSPVSGNLLTWRLLIIVALGIVELTSWTILHPAHRTNLHRNFATAHELGTAHVLGSASEHSPAQPVALKAVGGDWEEVSELEQKFESLAISVDESSLPENVSQHFTRAELPEGGEAVYGALRAEFAPQERSQTLHVAFCPPLACIPEFTANQLTGPLSTIKVTDVQLHGTRIDLRLVAPSDEPVEVVVEFYAHSANAQRVA